MFLKTFLFDLFKKTTVEEIKPTNVNLTQNLKEIVNPTHLNNLLGHLDKTEIISPIQIKKINIGKKSYYLANGSIRCIRDTYQGDPRDFMPTKVETERNIFAVTDQKDIAWISINKNKVLEQMDAKVNFKEITLSYSDLPIKLSHHTDIYNIYEVKKQLLSPMRKFKEEDIFHLTKHQVILKKKTNILENDVLSFIDNFLIVSDKKDEYKNYLKNETLKKKNLKKLAKIKLNKIKQTKKINEELILKKKKEEKKKKIPVQEIIRNKFFSR